MMMTSPTGGKNLFWLLLQGWYLSFTFVDGAAWTTSESGDFASAVKSPNDDPNRNLPPLNAAFSTRKSHNVFKDKTSLNFLDAVNESPMEVGTSSARSSTQKVTVVKERLLNGVNPEQAKKSWLDFVWKGGGGLPTAIYKVNANAEGLPTKRILFPPIMEEILTTVTETFTINDSEYYIWPSSSLLNTKTHVEYTVSKFGPFLRNDLVAGSHLGRVDFIPTEEGTMMVWKVDFETKSDQRTKFWQWFTDFTVGFASDSLVSYLAEPTEVVHQIELPVKATKAMDAWVDFVWNQGGGIPVPPIHIGGGQRLIPPLMIREKLQQIDYDNGEIIYKVPDSFYTYPVHDHLGTVRFDYNSTTSSTMMTWKVNVVPFHPLEGAVKVFTHLVISSVSKNLHNFLVEEHTRTTKNNDSERADGSKEHIVVSVDAVAKKGLKWLEQSSSNVLQAVSTALDGRLGKILDNGEIQLPEIPTKSDQLPKGYYFMDVVESTTVEETVDVRQQFHAEKQSEMEDVIIPFRLDESISKFLEPSALEDIQSQWREFWEETIVVEADKNRKAATTWFEQATANLVKTTTEAVRAPYMMKQKLFAFNREATAARFPFLNILTLLNDDLDRIEVPINGTKA